MPGGWNPLLATIRSIGPVGLWGFQELLAGSPVTAGSQDPQNFAFDSSASGNLNQVTPPYPNGNYLQIGSAVIVNAQPLAGSATPAINDDSVALFPSTGTTSVNNIITSGAAGVATGTFTITGSPLTGQNNTYTINGTAINAPQTTGNTVTQQAAADIIVINANTTANKVVNATASAGVITITALAGGSGGNTITIVGTGNAGDTVTASGGTLTGGSGVGAGAQPPILQPTTAMSIGCQVTPNVCSTGSVKQVMACYGSDGASLAAYNLYHSGSTAINHTFAFSVNIAGALKTATATLPVVVVGASYFVMGTYDGVNVRIYVNGVLQGTTAATGLINYASTAGYGLSVGNDGALSDANLQGSMGLVAIYNKALTQAQITYLARQGQLAVSFAWRH